MPGSARFQPCILPHHSLSLCVADEPQGLRATPGKGSALVKVTTAVTSISKCQDHSPGSRHLKAAGCEEASLGPRPSLTLGSPLPLSRPHMCTVEGHSPERPWALLQLWKLPGVHTMASLSCGKAEEGPALPSSLDPLPRWTHLLPDVIVAEEAAQLSLSEGPPMVGVLVAGQHLDAQCLHLAGVHGSGRGDRKGLVEDAPCLPFPHEGPLLLSSCCPLQLLAPLLDPWPGLQGVVYLVWLCQTPS